MEDTK
jgi:nucleolar protein 4